MTALQLPPPPRKPRRQSISLAPRLQGLALLLLFLAYAFDPQGLTRRATTYDALNRPQTLTSSSHTGTLLESYAEGYDAAGNLTQAVEAYQDPSRNRTVANTYDSANNRIVKTLNGAATTYTVNDLNQLTATSGAETATYTYDLNGNRATVVKSGGTDTYSYDTENRLVQLVQGGVTYSYAYDYRTRRVQRIEGGVATNVSFSGGTSAFEYDASVTGPVVEYVRGSDYGGGIGGVLYTLRGGLPSFNHYDNRGDVTAKTDASGAITYQAEYEAYGTRPLETGTTNDRQKANTKDEDPTGLLNEGHRYRDLATGTFITRDPAGFVDGPNLYSYVVDNPWTKFDPEGLASDDDKKNSPSVVQQVTDAVMNAVVPGRAEAHEKAESQLYLAKALHGDDQIQKDKAVAEHPMEYMAEQYANGIESENPVDTDALRVSINSAIQETSSLAQAQATVNEWKGDAVTLATLPLGFGLDALEIKSMAAEGTSGIRAAYEADVRALEDQGLAARAAGQDAKTTAEQLADARNALKVQ